MPKKDKSLTEIIPLRADAATQVNIQSIINSGLAVDKSAALRAAAAFVARTLSGDQRLWRIDPAGTIGRDIYATRAAAEAHLRALGATPSGDGWHTLDEDGDPLTWYDIVPIVPK
jgi:hypothetical protein